MCLGGDWQSGVEAVCFTPSIGLSVDAHIMAGRVWADPGPHRGEFGKVLLLEWYFDMLRDSARHDAYRAALQAEAKGKRVVDIGAGVGMLSFFAAEGGAEQVTGIELVPHLAAMFGTLARATNTDVEVLAVDARAVHRKEAYDVLVMELLDSGGMGENMANMARFAHRHLLRPPAVVIPGRVRIEAALAAVRTPPVAGCSVQPFDVHWVEARGVKGEFTSLPLGQPEAGGWSLLTAPTVAFDVDFSSPDDIASALAEHAVHFPVTRPGTANAVVWWFKATLADGIELSNAPPTSDGSLGTAPTHWANAVARLPEELELAAGGTVALSTRSDGYKIWWSGLDPVASPADGTPLQRHLRTLQSSTMQTIEQLRGEAMQTGDASRVSYLQDCVLAVAAQPWRYGVHPAAAMRALRLFYS
eukprot:Sspe_Gene.42327::Locus_20554_Transcript_1_1_Confidence_1.000_Length_2676::g.42327::m.42327/K11438/PRMT7; type III protein arginine methyltransferase